MAVSQNIRRALDVITALERLDAGLNKEPSSNNEAVSKLRGAINDTVDALEAFVRSSSRSGILGAKSALSQETRGRSVGQRKRQARIDQCD